MEEEILNNKEPNEIDILGLFAEIFSHWRKILVWVGVAAVLGIIVAVSIPKTYTSVAKLAPEIVQKGNSSMSSLAALAGISLNNNNTDAMYPDLYPEIVNSVPFRIDLFSMPVRFMWKDEPVETDLYDFVINYTKEPWWTPIISAPGKFISWISWLAHGRPEPIHGYENVDSFKLTGEQMRAASRIKDCISVTVEKKTFLITISVATQNPRISAELCKLVCDNLQQYVVNYRTEKSRHDLEYCQQLYDQAKKEYFDAQQKYARYVDANQGVVFQRVLIERDRLQQEANSKYQVYNTTSQQVQQAKAKVQLETPVFAAIQPPTVPLRESEPSKGKIIIAFMFLAFCFSAVWYQWIKGFFEKKRKARKDKEVKEEE